MWGRPRRIIRAVTRQVEPEWDDTTRERAEGLARYDMELCPGCNLHPVILDDPEHNHFTFEDRLCKVCAGQTQYGRMLAKVDQDWDERHPDAAPQTSRPGDGRHTYLRGMSREEVEALRASRQSGSGRPRPPEGPTRSR